MSARSPLTVAFAVVFTAAVAAALAGCSSADDDGEACARDPRSEAYVDGMAKPGAGIEVRILGASPSPPAKGENGLTVGVVDASGAPLDGATITVRPFMHDHGHGSALSPLVTPLGDGTFRVERLYLPMAGLWTISVMVAPPRSEGPAQEVSFSFCVSDRSGP